MEWKEPTPDAALMAEVLEVARERAPRLPAEPESRRVEPWLLKEWPMPLGSFGPEDEEDAAVPGRLYADGGDRESSFGFGDAAVSEDRGRREKVARRVSCRGRMMVSRKVRRVIVRTVRTECDGCR